jgi:hypothetical protein
MIDKKLEDNIKKARDFIEIWHKFHDIFKNTVSENHVGSDREREFLSVKDLVSSRYEDLMDSLGVKPLRRFMLSPSVYNILSFEKISIMSDKRLDTIDNDWTESLKFLKVLLERLEKKKRRIGGFNRFAFVVKKSLTRRAR